MKAPWYMKSINNGKAIKFHWLWILYQKIKFTILTKMKMKEEKENICRNCERWYGTPQFSYLVSRSYSLECGKTNPKNSCSAFVRRTTELTLNK